MKHIGFVKISRSILDWRWYKNPNTFKVFMHLLISANFMEAEFEQYAIKRGQVVTGINKLSEDTGLSIQQVRTALKHLKLTNDITINATTKFSIITICEYEKFLSSTSELTSNQHDTNTVQTNEQPQYNKNNNDNKYNKNNNYNYTKYHKNRNYSVNRKTSYDLDDFVPLFTD